VPATEYQLIYDANQFRFGDLVMVLPGLLLLGICLALTVRSRRSTEKDSRVPLYAAGMLLASAWTLGATSAIVRPALRVRDALNAGRYTLVEGVVANFSPRRCR
jgi:hypothetical protein